MLNQKGLAHIFLILILLVGIVVGVILVGRNQVFKPKATGGNIEIVDNECTKIRDGKKVLECSTVRLDIVSPLEKGNTSSVLAATSSTKGGAGYSCDKPGGDENKIYHQQCNAVIFGLDLCEAKLPFTHYDLIEEFCEVGQKCDQSSPDLFKTIAKCVPGDSLPPRGRTQNFTQPGFAETVPVQSEGNNEFIPTSPSLPTSESTAEPTAEPIVQPTPTPLVQPTPTDNDFSTPTPAPTPSPTIAPAGDTGGGTTNPPPGVQRTTKDYQVAESEKELKETPDWKHYKAGGMTINYPLKHKENGPKHFYVQFRDQDEKIIKFESGDEFSVSDVIELRSPSQGVGATTPQKPPPPPPPAAPPPAVTCKIAEPQRNCTLPTEKCEITTLEDIGNCTNGQLLGTLTKAQLGTIPLERMKTFGSNALMCFFPRDVVARLDAKILNDLPNEDLLLLGDASGDCKKFLSGFSCDRIVLLPLQYQALTSCGP